MVLSPLSEIPSFGRLNVYMITLFLFAVLQIPTALAPNYSTPMAMRFLAGFVCSPALSTGGATLSDVFKPMTIPYAVSLWAAGAVAGPVSSRLPVPVNKPTQSWLTFRFSLMIGLWSSSRRLRSSRNRMENTTLYATWSGLLLLCRPVLPLP